MAATNPHSTSPVRTRPVRVVQLSDFHLFARPDGALLGLNTQFSLERVLAQAREEHPRIDLILATGDLSQDGSLASYQRAARLLGEVAPTHWLVGNHDKPAPMQEALGVPGKPPCPSVVQAGNWTLILLDSTLPGEVSGALFDADLAFLERALAGAEGDHVLVAMHHQPVAMGCRWLDAHQIIGAERFFEVIDADPRVKAIVWGHVHQAFEGERNGVRLMSVPSTCIQFKPDSEDFAIDDLNPGYRWLDLHPDGRIDSAVSRVRGIDLKGDPSQGGY